LALTQKDGFRLIDLLLVRCLLAQNILGELCCTTLGKLALTQKDGFRLIDQK
jgi:hypothetical protein